MREKILITVKTYPTLSKKYAELVCTAGVNEAGEWRRIYPIQFRQLADESKYKKYQWIEADIEKSTSDNRPETYKVKKPDAIKLLGDPIPTGGDWSERRKHFVDQVETHTDLKALIERAHKNELSLGIFKPAKFKKFEVKQADRNWDPKKLAVLEQEKQQLDLFRDESKIEEDFKIVDKLPYKFSYKLEDENGKESTMMIEDWEIGALYRNCLRHANGDENVAVEKVRQKYWDEFVEKETLDTHLVLGTTLQHHFKNAPNPFVIISVLPLPANYQPTLL